MLKEFAQYLTSVRENKTYEINGDTYSDHDLVRIEPHIYRPSQITVSGLDSIVHLIEREEYHFEEQYPIYVQVKSETEVCVFTSFDEWKVRNVLYRAVCDTNPIKEGFRSYETAIIELRSRFIQNEGTEYLLGLLSRINVERGITSTDNGVTQTVESRRGISLKQMENIKPRVSLCPYRTFREVEQPESEYLLRLDEDGNIGFFEADGGIWKLNAKDNIANYFESMLEELVTDGKVVVMK